VYKVFCLDIDWMDTHLFQLHSAKAAKVEEFLLSQGCGLILFFHSFSYHNRYTVDVLWWNS
jgi:hypothetical protein